MLLRYRLPRAACFYTRRALELAVIWAYKHDAALRLPYQDNLSAPILEPSFKQAAGEGFVDYVLWGDDGRPLGLVEAKRTRLPSRALGSRCHPEAADEQVAHSERSG